MNSPVYTSPSLIRRWTQIVLTIAFAIVMTCGFANVGTAKGATTEDKGLLPTDGLPVASWDEAAQLIGRRAVVYGKIEDIGHAEAISFLNFKKRGQPPAGANGERPKRVRDFTVVIFGKSDAAFSDTYEKLFLDKNVTVVGTITVYRGTPQIVVADPDQIQVVDKLPKTNIVKPVEVKVGKELVIGSYNIENLFDAKDDPYHNDEGTAAKPREDMRNVANVIREINADVLALQEVESRGYLQQFIETMLYDMGYKHIVHFEGNDKRGIDVCLISRIPVGAVTSHRHHVFKAHDGGDQRFGRDLLRVELLPEGGEPFEMWVVHLKSNSGGKELNEPIRLGECHEVHRLIAKRLREAPDTSLILCGDFNDEMESKSLQTILGSPPQLQTIFDNIPEDERITYNKEPYRSMIDFMLCSPAMADRMVPGTFKIRAGTDIESGADHNPIYAKFQKGVAKEVATSAAPVGAQTTSRPTTAAVNASVESSEVVQQLQPSSSPSPANNTMEVPVTHGGTRTKFLTILIAGMGVVVLGVVAAIAILKSRTA